jgi:hypothetical protein
MGKLGIKLTPNRASIPEVLAPEVHSPRRDVKIIQE